MRLFEKDHLPKNQNAPDLIERYKVWAKSKKYKNSISKWKLSFYVYRIYSVLI